MHNAGCNTLQTISSIEKIKACNKGADDKVKLLRLMQQKHWLITLKKNIDLRPWADFTDLSGVFVVDLQQENAGC